MASFLDRFSEIRKIHQKRVREVNNDPTLSAVGKRDAINHLKKETLTTYKLIQNEAQQRVDEASRVVREYSAAAPQNKPLTMEAALNEQRQVQILLGQLVAGGSDAMSFTQTITATQPQTLMVAFAQVHDLANQLFPTDGFAVERGTAITHLRTMYQQATESLVTPAEKAYKQRLSELKDHETSAFAELMSVERLVRLFEQTVGPDFDDVAAAQ